MHYILGRLVVTFVLCLISFIAYSSQIFIIWPWYGSELSVELVTLLAPFNILVAILFYNYYLCVVTDPGTVPPNWANTHAEGYEVKKLTGAPRFCRNCQCYKPARTHHCRDCNRCVLRMDHHCPWINNCVGHFNYSHFLRFLFYVDLACSYHLFMLVKRVLHAMDGRFWIEPSTTELIMIIMNFVACVPVLLAVGGFSVYHFFNLLGNSTTIEGWEKDKVATMVRKGQIHSIKFPYDLGKVRNIKAVLGDNPLLWCLPRAMPGNGTRFELSSHTVPGEIWPPKEHEPERAPLPESPWTYENGSFNPDLVPTNTRARPRRKVMDDGVYNLPPYHPDFEDREIHTVRDEEQALFDEESEDEEEEYYTYSSRGQGHVRRGSEGYEVRSINREDLLRQYLEEINAPDRYVRYEPEPSSDSDDSEDDVPLGAKKVCDNAVQV
ncbi:hypothetical protein MD484_g1990, partial [Candolleomyces efflorescens]